MAILPRQSQPPPAQQSAFSSTIYIPVIAVVVVLLALLVGSWLRKRFFPSTQSSEAAAAVASLNSADAGAQARRPRRNRRRASQISTRSLPAYMEEPGDEELVLVSRREPMPTLEEGNQSRLSLDSQGSDDAHNQTPLLERDPNEMPFSNAVPSVRRLSSQDDHMQQMPNGSSAVSLPSDAPLVESPSTTHSIQLRRISSQPTDTLSPPLGSAPPYFEVSDNEDEPSNRPMTRTPTTSSEPPATLNRTPSLFRTLFPRNTDGHLTAPTPGEGTARSNRHVASNSITSLRQTLSLSRTASGRSSAEEPSSSRLNISAPLTHTVVKTDFQYPRAGPTEDQIKFLSSRESLGRFGVPFGTEAIAAAVEPPPFAVVAGEGHHRRPSFDSTLTVTTEEGSHPTVTVSSASLDDPLQPRPAPTRTPQLRNLRLPEIITSPPTPHSPPPLTPAKLPIAAIETTVPTTPPAIIPLPPSPAVSRPES